MLNSEAFLTKELLSEPRVFFPWILRTSYFAWNSFPLFSPHEIQVSARYVGQRKRKVKIASVVTHDQPVPYRLYVDYFMSEILVLHLRLAWSQDHQFVLFFSFLALNTTKRCQGSLIEGTRKEGCCNPNWKSSIIVEHAWHLDSFLWISNGSCRKKITIFYLVLIE